MLQRRLMCLRNFPIGYFMERFIKLTEQKLAKQFLEQLQRLGNINKKYFMTLLRVKLIKKRNRTLILSGLGKIRSSRVKELSLWKMWHQRELSMWKQEESMKYFADLDFSTHKWKWNLCWHILKREDSDLYLDNRRRNQKFYFFTVGSIKKLEKYHIYT